MKFSKKNKIAILLLLGIGISGFILGFIQPRITLINSEAAGWGKPQANIENKEVQLGIYDVLFVKYETDIDLPYTDEEEILNRFTLKILINISNPFEDTGLIIPRIDLKLGHLEKPVGRLWTLEEFKLDAFDVDPNNQGDSVEKQLEKRNDTNAAGLWSVYLALYTGEDSGLNFLINDIFEGNMGTISFDATIELGNYPINVEGIFGELLKLVGLGLGGTESGAFTDEPIPETLANALGAELDRINPSVRANSIFMKQIDFINSLTHEMDSDIRTLTEDTNVSIFTDDASMTLYNITGEVTSESVYFGSLNPFHTLYLPNATSGNMAMGNGVYIWEYYNGTGWSILPILDNTIDNFNYSNSQWWDAGYLSWSDITSNWDATKIYDRFTNEYFFIRCRNGTTLDTGINSTTGDAIRVDIKHSRIGNSIKPLVEPEPEENTVFSEGGISLDDMSILAEDEQIIVYPGIDPSKVPDRTLNQTGILQYGEGDFDQYISDKVFGGEGDFVGDLVMPEIILPEQGGVVEALSFYGKSENTVFFDGDLLGKNPSGIDVGSIFFNLFTALYTHNISASDFLVASQLDISHLIDTLASKMVQYSPNEFTHEDMWVGVSQWEDSLWDDDDTIYEWSEQAIFKQAESTSWILFGVLGAVAILSVPYNMMKKEDQSKFLSGSDISNAKDLMEDTTGKTVLIGSVSSMDSEKMRWELLGGFAGVGIGILLYLLKDVAFPDFNDAVIYSFLPEILQSLFENSRNLDNNPYSPLVILLTAFIDFPGIFAWFIPALFVSLKRNKQFTNIKKRRVGWDVFWKGAYMIEFVLAIMAIGLGISTLIGNQDYISYFAGGLIFIVFLFITPYFYFAIGIAGLGGFIGSRIGLKNPGDSEVTFTEEYLAEGDDYGGTSDYDEYAEYEEDEYEEYEDTDRTEIVDFDSQGEVVGMVCKYCWETYPVGTDSCGKCGNTDVSQAIECSNCGNMIPIDAKFCNECGTNL